MHTECVSKLSPEGAEEEMDISNLNIVPRYGVGSLTEKSLAMGQKRHSIWVKKYPRYG